jgi:aspartyl/glutamyl-tRNA(Asn/Gln) amidotransferase C subunit
MEGLKGIKASIYEGVLDGDDDTGGYAPKREKISIEEVKHVAKLARLSLTGEETEKYRADLNSILDYVAALENLDTTDVAPMSHVLEMKNVWRNDKPVERENPQELLKNAPEREEAYYRVPKILEGN